MFDNNSRSAQIRYTPIRYAPPLSFFHRPLVVGGREEAAEGDRSTVSGRALVVPRQVRKGGMEKGGRLIPLF